MPNKQTDAIGALVDCHVAAEKMFGLGEFGALSVRASNLSSDLVSRGGRFARNCDGAFVRNIVCGNHHGILLGVCTGNYKDEGCAVAVSVAAASMVESFEPHLLSLADIAPGAAQCGDFGAR